MAKSGISQIVEQIGAESLAQRLREQIQNDQRRIAIHYSHVDGMQYPHNLLGEMEKLLSERKYSAIEEKIVCWRQWIEDTGEVHQMLERTLILIESFVMWYRVENDAD